VVAIFWTLKAAEANNCPVSVRMGLLSDN
jgi:hypothetical protein